MSQFIQIIATVILSLSAPNSSSQENTQHYAVLVHREQHVDTSEQQQFERTFKPKHTPKTFVLEEIYDDLAILSTDQGRIYIPKDLLPSETHEGTVLKISALEEETELRLAEARRRIDRMQRMSR